MKITRGIKATIPYAILAAFAILDGPGMSKVLYKIVKKEINKRHKAGVQKELEKATFRTLLTRLKKDDLVESPARGLWQLTKKGLGFRAAISKKEESYRKFVADHGKERDTIVIFDVPKKKGSLRHHLRAELIDLGYELLQKSVWIGGGPLPEEFIAYLKEKDLLRSVHIFTVQKRGTIT